MIDARVRGGSFCLILSLYIPVSKPIVVGGALFCSFFKCRLYHTKECCCLVLVLCVFILSILSIYISTRLPKSVLSVQILNKGIGLTTGSDSELIMQILSQPPPTGEEEDGPNWPARIRHLMSLTPTAYSLIMMYDDTIYAVRDPFGNRPLSIGVLVPPSGIKGM